MKRPFSLTVVAIIWFSLGVLGVVGDEIKRHGLEILNVNFINILVGLGLLNGWRLSRWYALCVTGYAFVLILPFTPWALCNAGRIVFSFPGISIDDRPHETMSLGLMVVVLLSYLLGSGWVFFVLQRRDVRELFARRPQALRTVATV